MSDLNIILLLILLTYQAVVSIMDMRDMKKYKNIEITERIKVNFYKEIIVFGWIPVFIIFLFVAFSPLSLYEIGIRKITISDSTWLNIITFIISLIIVIMLLYQTIMYFVSEKYRHQISIELNTRREKDKTYDSVTSNIVIPCSLKEKKYFFFASLTAGVCEEIVWRGCILFLLSDIFPSFNIVVISILACLLFGFNHCYQGLYGIIKTSIGATLFVLIYLTTNSLILGIVLHFMFDFSSAFLVRGELK